MEFMDRLNALAAKVRNQRDIIGTEEAAKNAFIMPFLDNVLGYDVFNPTEVIPEYTADVGLKKGEKVDYAILRNGNVQILVECKRSDEPLDLQHASQLYRYFAVTNARIALLTNGQVYNFYTDLDAPNRMDAQPFLVLDLANIDTAMVPELAKLSKEQFDLESVISAAEELKYVSQIKRHVAQQFKNPEYDWVKFFTSRVYSGQFTQKIREQFTELVGKASSQFLNDQVNSRLKTALGADGFTATPKDTEEDPGQPTGKISAPDSGVVTTSEELEGYAIIKAIGCSEVPADRIVSRDSKSYFAVLLDDNNRQPIARLHFNGERQKYIGLLDAEKRETRHPIEALNEIYEHADSIREAVNRYV